MRAVTDSPCVWHGGDRPPAPPAFGRVTPAVPAAAAAARL